MAVAPVGGTEPWVGGDGQGHHLPCVVTSFFSFSRPRSQYIHNQLQVRPDLFKLGWRGVGGGDNNP